jgi:hypothetical protein
MPSRRPRIRQREAGTTGCSAILAGMGTRRLRVRGTIRRRIVALALACALVPVVLLALMLVLTAHGGALTETGMVGEVQQSVQAQLQLNLDAQAQRINCRLEGIGRDMLMIAAHASEALSKPEAFAGAGAAPAKPAGQPADAAKPAPSDATSPKGSADNPLFYTKVPGGVLRKVVEDGGPAVYYAAREGGRDFTSYEKQRMYTTATLDPLLEQVGTDKLCGQVYLLTEDNLLRTYPWRDLATLDARTELSDLSMYAWSKDKANGSGLVWTLPYQSQVLNQWVVACHANVNVGGKRAGTVGFEIPLSSIAAELFGFSLGQGGGCWLQSEPRESQPLTLLLAGQPGSEELLGVTSLATAELPSDKLKIEKIYAAASVLDGKKKEVPDVLRNNADGAAHLTALEPASEGRFVAVAPLSVGQWTLAGVVHSQALAAAYRYQRYAATRLSQRLILSLAAILVGVLLAILLSWLETRRIAMPLTILTQRLQQAVRQRSTTSLAIPEEGELGLLSRSVQELLDIAFGVGVGAGSASAEPGMHGEEGSGTGSGESQTKDLGI